jgi:hypothetical protein
MDFDEPHLTLNEQTQPIQWIERPAGALVVAGSFWHYLLASSQDLKSRKVYFQTFFLHLKCSVVYLEGILYIHQFLS